MSVELVLIPLAMAAIAAWQARSIEKGDVCIVQTRLKDPVLLAQALAATGAVEVSENSGRLHADWGDLKASFSQGDGGVLTAHFESEDRDRSISLVAEIDRAYGLAVQRVVLERIQQRAMTMGMEVASERALSDGSVTIVLEEVRA